jgi:hypothetical protein
MTRLASNWPGIPLLMLCDVRRCCGLAALVTSSSRTSEGQLLIDIQHIKGRYVAIVVMHALRPENNEALPAEVLVTGFPTAHESFIVESEKSFPIFESAETRKLFPVITQAQKLL